LGLRPPSRLVEMFFLTELLLPLPKLILPSLKTILK
jgi:hypothetical protein